MEAPAQSASFEDALLVRQVQAGEVQAFTQLVRKYQDRVYNTCLRLCGHAEDARDLTQEAFLKAFESIAAFHGKSAFYTWVFRIAVNLSISHRRKSSRRAVLSLDAGHDSAAAGDGAVRGRGVADASAGDPAAECAAAEDRVMVAAALSHIDPDHRVVLVLRDIEGFDYQEIADILELAVGTVKSRIFRGRMALRQRLCGLSGEETLSA